MRPILLLTIAFLLPSACCADENDDWKNMLGDWKLVSAKRDGTELPKNVKGSLKVEKGKFTFTYEVDGKKQSQTTGVIIDFSKSPKHVDLFMKRGRPSKHGILKLEDKKLTFCYDSTLRDRPKKFEAKKGSREQLLVYGRVEKKK